MEEDLCSLARINAIDSLRYNTIEVFNDTLNSLLGTNNLYTVSGGSQGDIYHTMQICRAAYFFDQSSFG